MELEFDLYYALFLLITIILSTIPLHFAARVLGGRTTYLKTLYVLIFVAILTSIISYFIPFGGFVGFIVLIFVYHEMFRISWFKAIFVWLFQLLFIFILGLILEILGLPSFASLFELNQFF